MSDNIITIKGNEYTLTHKVEKLSLEKRPQSGKIAIITLAIPVPKKRIVKFNDNYAPPSYILRIDTIIIFSDRGIRWLIEKEELSIEIERIRNLCKSTPEAVYSALAEIQGACDAALMGL